MITDADAKLPLDVVVPRRRFGLSSVIAFAALACWFEWWIASMLQGRLLDHGRLWFARWDFLGLDFRYNALAVQHLFKGGNPFAEPFGHPFSDRYAAHPLLFWMFSWCGMMSIDAAYAVWWCASVAILGGAAELANRTRTSLGLTPLPALVPQALILSSIPAIFALERGNWDVLALAAVMIVCVAAKRGGLLPELVIALAIGFSVWIKYYPAVLVPVLVIVGRYRAAALSLAAIAAVGLAALGPMMQTYQQVHDVARYGDVGYMYHVGHSLTTHWQPRLTEAGLPRLASIPGLIGSSAVLFPLAGCVSYFVFRSDRRAALLLPMSLWAIQATTFWFPMSYDYKIFFVLLALVAVCGKRDGFAGALIVLVTAAWAEPFRTTNSLTPVFLLKLASLIGAAWLLTARARERVEEPVADAAHSAPANLGRATQMA